MGKKELKKKFIPLHPNQIKIHYLKTKGDKLEDCSEAAHLYLFEVEFIGVNLDPMRVVGVTYPELNYGHKGEAFVVVEYIDESVHLPKLNAEELMKYKK